MKTILKKINPFQCEADIRFVLKKIMAFWLCYLVGLFLAEGAAILLHFAMGKNMLVGDVFDNQTITLIMYYGYVVVIVVVLLYWKFFEKKPLSAMGISKGFSGYFLGMFLAVLLLLASIGIIVWTGNMKYDGMFADRDYLTTLLFLGGFMVQGAMEEMLCRGFLLHALKEKIALPAAIAVSTVMFILPHWFSLFAGKMRYGIIGIINLILISIIFSLLTIYGKNIWTACGLHSFWNFILYSVLGLNVSGNDGTAAIWKLQSVGANIWNGGRYGVEASVVTTAVLGIFCIVLLWVCDY